jgi:hypothetical protein
VNSVIKAIRYVIFYLMLWFRGIFMIISRPLAGLFMLGGIIFLLFMGLDKPSISCFIVSFCIFILMQVYDTVLLKINPTDVTYYLK